MRKRDTWLISFFVIIGLVLFLGSPLWICVIISPGIIVSVYQSIWPLSATQKQTATLIVAIICYTLAIIFLIYIGINFANESSKPEDSK